ncbi:basic secretory protein-like protein [Pedobacter nutrimenti]|uniref:basic secretory protein-like protein n=1 Tax=Pedobacter nutrimenti TaxID=1241337 RepID=UPI0029313B9D|nr:basic secretory protein-like protein [Pedobacter nutrimenti]
MKKNFLLTTCLAIACSSFAHAQSTEVIQKKGYKLTFINQDANLDQHLKARLIETFFTVYPKLEKEYNKKTAKDITFVIDTAYDGVAATANARVVYSSKYMAKHPVDIDVVTHEVMHIVQDYGNSGGPGWLTEGIADYARYTFGVDNAGAHWELPAFKPTQHYSNAYRTTARFLVWLEKSVKPGLVKTFDKQLREHTFTDNSWKKETGKTLDELWTAYAAHPELS